MKLDERPHTAGGVTAIVTLPGAGRLRFITGGEDKKCVFLRPGPSPCRR